MKNLLAIIIVALLAGCASNSTLTSTMIKNPDLVAKGSNLIELRNFDVKVRVNDDLQFVDQVKLDNISNDKETESYLYAYVSEGKAKRLVTVEVETLTCDNCTFGYWGQPGTIKKGKIRLVENEQSYQIMRFSDLHSSRYVLDSAIRLGFILPETVIMKSYSYLLDKKNHNRLLVTYYEDASEFGLLPSTYKDDVTHEQAVKVQGYLKRCLESNKVQG